MTNEELRLAIAKAKGWTGPTVVGQVFAYYSPDGRMRAALPNWPTSIADAWELVEEVIASGIGWCPGFCFDDHDGDRPPEWVAEFNRYWKKGSDYSHYEAAATTAPRAICEAWLEWKAAK